MIRARTNNLVLLGIDAENVERLKDGKDILVEGRQLGLGDITIAIAYGDTLQDIIDRVPGLGGAVAQGAPPASEQH